jgi:hypothetical protein
MLLKKAIAWLPDTFSTVGQPPGVFAFVPMLSAIFDPLM